MRLPTQALALLGLAALVCVHTACKPAAPKPLDLSPQLNITVAGRTILAQLPNPARIEAEGEVALVFSGSHKIAVERERVLLDGKELVKLPVVVRSVGFSVSSTSGILTVFADAQAIATTPFPK